ncbi:hypothetical protein M569_10381 [Genlisea aurea]|uniref:Uncharacterized protein n=1 Tax=Genlisea aurea TaxID=192259 RepID=S8CC05_9LAMI|nr:hypothetical protein M569_10381 [Genlisea aurea]
MPLQLQHIKLGTCSSLYGFSALPFYLLITGVIPTLWLPISSIFLGPHIASLLSLIGLDCIFNLGASLFLLMADFAARPNDGTQSSSPPSSYQFRNMAASVTGFLLPLATLAAAQKGFLQPQLPPIAVAVILAPYLLLLSVQMITESLTWHWPVSPVIYEAYRVLQLTPRAEAGFGDGRGTVVDERDSRADLRVGGCWFLGFS